MWQVKILIFKTMVGDALSTSVYRESNKGVFCDKLYTN